MIERRIREELFTEAERKRIEAEGKTHVSAKRKQIKAPEKKTPQDVVGLWSRIKNVTPARAIADLGFAMDLLSPGQHARLLRDLSEADRTGTPEWNRETCELRYGGKLVRKIRRLKIAKNLVAILDEFQSKNWPDRVDNPLGDKGAQTMRESIAALNTGLSVLIFRSDGAGAGIVWGLRTARAPPARRP
jgi:hypothetical protein